MNPTTANTPQQRSRAVAPQDAAAMKWLLLARVALFARRALWLGRAERLLMVFAAVLASMLVLIVLDAVVVLPTPVRVIGLFMQVLLVMMGLAYAWHRPAGRAASLRDAGRSIDDETACGSPWVVIGLESGQSSDGDDPLRAALLERTVERGRLIADVAQPGRVFPVARLRQPASRLWLVVSGGVVLGLIFPGLLPIGGARLMMPMSQTPPFNLTTLVVYWTPAEPQRGQDVRVTVVPMGLTPKGVDMQLMGEGGAVTDTFAMTSIEDGQYRVVLRRVQEPIRFRLIVNDRPTRTYTIVPTEPIVPTPEDGDEDSANPTAGDDPGTGTDTQPQAGGDAAAWAAKAAGLVDRLEALLRQIEQADPGDAQAMRAVSQAIEQLLQDADALAGQAAPASADASSAALSDALRRLVDQLEAMRLRGVGEVPVPDDATAQEDAEAARRWLDQAEQAAREDQRNLAQGVGAWPNPTDSGTTNRDGGPADPTPNDPTATGQFDAASPDGGAGDLPEAVLRQVPARYRDHIAAYFRALAQQDADRGPQPEDQP